MKFKDWTCWVKAWARPKFRRIKMVQRMPLSQVFLSLIGCCQNLLQVLLVSIIFDTLRFVKGLAILKYTILL